VIHPRSTGQRVVARINYTLVTIVLALGLFVAIKIADAFLSGRVAQILGGAR
jgi:hypothetical protein